MLDLDEGTAQALVCVQGDHELVDIETGEVINSFGDGDAMPSKGTYYVTLTDEGWELSEWFYSGETELTACEFSSSPQFVALV